MSFTKIACAIGIALSMLAADVSAQIYVKVRPSRPHYARITAPGPRHLWIEDDWTLNGDAYTWNGGRWAEPPSANVVWVPGHWRHRHHGWTWVPGRWR
jgi:hypothetical protein